MSKKNNVNLEWGTGIGVYVCEACDWSFLVSGEDMSIQCPHCFKTKMSSMAENLDELSVDISPELILHFNLENQNVKDRIDQFARGIPLSPRDLTPGNVFSRIRKIYLPMWLVDVQVDASWSGETGFNYEVVSHQDRFDEYGGGWKSTEVKETRIRWEIRSGKLSRKYHNIPAPALEAKKNISKVVEGFDLDRAVVFDKQAIESIFIRLPNRISDDAWGEAKPHLLTLVSDDCRRAADADHLRQFTWQPEFTNFNWTLLLLPVFSTYYLNDEGDVLPVILHGQTGQISGPRYASKLRAEKTSLIILTIAIGIFVVSLLLALASILLPATLIIAMLSFLLSLIVGICAIIPIAVVWNFNRQQKNYQSN